MSDLIPTGLYPGQPGGLDYSLPGQDNTLSGADYYKQKEFQIQQQGYRIPVADWENDLITKTVAAIADNGGDPTDAKYKMATAMHYSRLFDVPLNHALKNFDALNKFYLGSTGIPVKRNWEAVGDAWKAGNILLDFNQAAVAWKRSGGTDAKAEQMADNLYSQMEGLEDKVPRPWYIEALKAGVQSAPFTMKVMAASGAGTAVGVGGAMMMAGAAGLVIGTGGLGAIPLALIAAFGTAGGMSMGLAQSAQDMEGVEYYRMRKLGVSHDIASPTSAITANLMGLVEVGMGNIPGLVSAIGGRSAIKTLTGTIMKKIGTKNLLGPVARAGMGYVGQGLEEGLEEGIQQFISNAADIVTTELEGAGAEKKDIEHLVEGIGPSMKEGIMASMIMGIPGNIIAWKGNSSEAKALSGMAEQLDQEDFIRMARKSEPAILEGLTEADQTTVLSRIWEAQNGRAAQREQMKTEAIPTEEQLERAEASEKPGKKSKPMEAKRLSDGRLYAVDVVTLSEPAEGVTEGMVKAGDPTPGGGKRYGHLMYFESEDTVTITDVKTNPGYESIRKDLVVELAANKVGKEIIWEPRSQALKAIKQDIIATNPRKSGGLQWFEPDTDVGQMVARQDLRSRLTKWMPRLDEAQRETAIELLNTRAEALNIPLDEYLERYHAEEVFTTSPEVEAAQGKKGGVVFKQVEGDAKALIYVTKNSDFSTWTHENFHIFRRQLSGEMLDLAENAYGVVDHKWTREQEEAWAEDGEHYLLTGEAPTEELKTLFQKIAQFMKRIYETISGKEEIDPRIKKVMDSLFIKPESPMSRTLEIQEETKQETEGEMPLFQRETPFHKNTKKEEKPKQPTNDIEVLYENIEEGLEAFEQFVQTFAEKYGATVEHRPESKITGKRIKDEDRAERKLNEDDGPETLSDIAGSTVIFSDYKTLYEATKDLFESDQAARIKDRFWEPTPEGYRDMLINIRMDDGYLYELQLTMPQIKSAKDILGHLLYEVKEQLETAFKKGDIKAKNWVMAHDEINNLSNNLYDLAEIFVEGSKYFTTSSFDMAQAFESISAILQDSGAGTSVLSSRTRNKLAEFRSKATILSSQSKNSKPGEFISILSPPSKNILQKDTDNKPLFQDVDSLLNKYEYNEYGPTAEDRKIIYGEIDPETVAKEVQLELDFLDKSDRGDVSGEAGWVYGEPGKSTVPGDWKKHRRIDFTGRKFTSPKELAELFAVYRHPRIEHFHIVYERNNEIIAHNVMSSGLIGASTAIDKRTAVQSFYALEKRIERLGADHFYLIHNHPSGNVTASIEDTQLTRAYKSNFPELAGHIIIDHDTYNLITFDDGGSVIDFKISYKGGDLLSKEPLSKGVTSPDEAAVLAKNIIHGESKAAVLVMNNQNELIAWVPFNSEKAVSNERVHQIIQEAGGNRAVIAVDNKKLYLEQTYLVSEGRGHIYDRVVDIIAVGENAYASALEEKIITANTSHISKVLEKRRDKAAGYVWEPETLYQSEKEILDEAGEFESWKEWRDFNQAMTPEEDLSAEQLAADNAWYKEKWEQAHRPTMPTEEGVALDPDALDDQFIERMADKETLNSFLNEIGYLTTESFDVEPDTREEYEERERISALSNRLGEEVHPTVLNNALRVAHGKELTTRARKSIITLMKQAPRDYRALYAEVTGEEMFTVTAEELKDQLPEIESPKLPAMRRMSISQRVALSRKFANQELGEKIRSGEIVVDEELKNYMDDLKQETTDLAKQIEDLEKSVSRGEQVIGHKERKIREMTEALDIAEKELIRVERRINELTEQKRQVNERMKEQRFQAELKVENLKEEYSRKMMGQKALEKANTLRVIRELKEQHRAKLKDMKMAQEIRRYKTKLAARIMRKPSNKIHWDQRQIILDIQDSIDPNFRRVTSGERKDLNKLIITLQEHPGVLDYVPIRIKGIATNRNLSTMSIQDLESTAALIDSVSRFGKLRRAMWYLQRQEESRISREVITEQIIKSGKYTNPPAYGSTEAQKERRGLKSFIRNFDYSFLNTERKAMMLDGDKEGENHRILIQEERKHRRKKLRTIKDRMEPVIAFMKKEGMKVTDLYKTHNIERVGPGNTPATFTTSDLLYVMAATQNSETYAAVAYGNLLSSEEKSNMDKEEVLLAGAMRMEKLYQYAENTLSDTEKMIVQMIDADFTDNFQRLNQVAIEEFNEGVKRVDHYVPIKRKEMTYDDLRAAMADDLLNLNGKDLSRIPKRGFIKSRITISPKHQKPTDMDLFGTWRNSVDAQEHFIEYTGYVRELNMIYKSGRDAPTIRALITGAYGNEMLEYLDDQILEYANPSAFVQRDNGSRFLRALRGDLAAAYLGYKLSSIVTQVVTSPMPYLAYVDPIHLSMNYLKVLSNPIKAWEAVAEKSDIMRTRSIDPIFAAIKQSQKDKPGKKGSALKSIGMKGLEWADRVSVVSGWLSVYEKALKENGGNEEAAIEKADNITLKTQPSGQAEDLSPAFKTKQEAWRVFLQFQSQLNIIWQNIRYDLPTAIKNKEYGRAIGIAYSYMVAGALLGLAKEGFKKDDDERDKAINMLYWSMTQFSDAVPLLGSSLSTVVKRAVTGEQEPFFASSIYPAASTLLSGFGKLTDKKFASALKDFGYSAGYFVGAPVSGVKEGIRAAEELKEGSLAGALGRLAGRRD